MILAIGALLSVFAVSVEAETRDGFWWARQSQSAKIYYVLGSIDRTMLTGSIDETFKHDVVGTPPMGEIVAQVDRIYVEPTARPKLVQEIIALALYQLSRSASSGR